MFHSKCSSFCSLIERLWPADVCTYAEYKNDNRNYTSLAQQIYLGDNVGWGITFF